jgi:hypothetical protein
MVYKVLPIPGQTTRYEDRPQLVIVGGGNTSLSVTVAYHASEITADQTILLGEITFSDVLEFRWIEHDAAYEEHPQHEGDFEFGLIEIQDSAYIETMASRGRWREYPGTRIRGDPESGVRHFRMGFDEWGTLDVIATKIATSSKVVPWRPAPRQ